MLTVSSLFMYLFIYVFIYLFIYVFIYLLIYLFIYLFKRSSRESRLMGGDPGKLQKESQTDLILKDECEVR